MKTVIAYVLVFPVVQFCFDIAVYITSFPIAIILAWTSISLRTKIAGFCGGIFGIAASIALASIIFRFLVGPTSFTLAPFLVCVVSLLMPIRNDYRKYVQVKGARDQLLSTINESRDAETTSRMAKEMNTSHGSLFVGETAGLVMAFFWFFYQSTITG